MEALSRIATTAIEKAPQSSGEVSLSIRQGPPLPAATAQVIQRLWMQTVAAKPNQTLPEGTPDMYLAQWEALVLRYGLLTFRDALSRAIEGRFFPAPEDIAEHCQAIARDEREREAARNHLDKLAELKAQCERERAEDMANGPREKSETELRLEAILAAAREDMARRTK